MLEGSPMPILALIREVERVIILFILQDSISISQRGEKLFSGAMGSVNGCIPGWLDYKIRLYEELKHGRTQTK